ncbi:hypothetical protein ERO13_D02G233400v2 [Gossypium hirsutum]|nr:hypothetical protein ERO13_D02G233400v2 [Gossypium hirsutum]KAG4160376.1 hypothetical protein ERO13_D02G233400v2 [Gossypium hirsutum]
MKINVCFSYFFFVFLVCDRLCCHRLIYFYFLRVSSSEHTISLHGFCFVKVFLKLLQLIQIDMADVDRGESPSRLEGKFSAAVACWILGFGSLICWNSMLTMGDY